MPLTSAASLACPVLASIGSTTGVFSAGSDGFDAGRTPAYTAWRSGRCAKPIERLSVGQASQSLPSLARAAFMRVLERPLAFGNAQPFDHVLPSRCETQYSKCVVAGAFPPFFLPRPSAVAPVTVR